MANRTVAALVAPVEDDPRAAALLAIERRHGASIRRTTESGTYTVLDAFRRREGLWWLRAVRRNTAETIQLLVVPNPSFTALRPDAEIVLTKVTCGACVYYEAAQA